jgi:hypothetical protein
MAMATRRLSFFRMTALGLTLLCGFFSARVEAAQVHVYASIKAWNAAVARAGGKVLTFDIGDIQEDHSFVVKPVRIGKEITLSQIGVDPFGQFRNFIDVPPLQFGDNNGHANIAMYTKYNVSSVKMEFEAPVYAFGAQFFGAQSGELEYMTLNAPDGSAIATVPVSVDTHFFGVLIAPPRPIGSITFESQIQNPDPSVGQGFALENLIVALYHGK